LPDLVNDITKSADKTVDDPQPAAFSPAPSYRVNEKVEIRYYGDVTWIGCVVVSIHAGCLYDVRLDDDESIEYQVEAHMIRSRNPKSPAMSENDENIYKRGDYVEMKLASGVWKRARCAVDKKNGTYDVRMEDGSDHKGIVGRWLRHHFRPNEKVDARLPSSSQWKVKS